MIKGTIVFVCCLMLASIVHAQSLEILVGPPQAPVTAGESVDFAVYYHNPGQAAQTVTLPDRLPCSLAFGGTSVAATAERLDAVQGEERQVPAGGYIKVRYRLPLPSQPYGPAVLEIPVLSDVGLAITVARGAASATNLPEPTSEEAPPEAEAYDLSALTSIYQPYAKNIAVYRPMYFLVGVDPSESKFQFSFKYRFLYPEKEVAQKHPWIHGIHFGYTQTSFWDLKSDSAPFEDTSYNAELFYLSRNIPTRYDWLKGFFIQSGFQHESNGRGGDDSRSTNYAYLEPSFVFMDEAALTGLKITPRIWAYLGNDETTNPDLYRYRGYFDLQLTFGQANSFIVDSHLGWAAEGGSAQVDVTYPLHRLFGGNLELYLQVSYTNALAARLISYQERNEALRIGLAIVR